MLAAAVLAAGTVWSGVASAKGPESLADLAASVTPAVVNISASTRSDEAARPRTGPQPGTPFEDLFEEFFRRRGQAPGRGEAPRPRRSNSLGSGFVIDASGIVVTNNHVIGEANDIQVIFSDGTKLKAEIVGRDAKTDIAVLRVKPEKPLKAVPFGDSETMRPGDWVMAIGNPFGLGGSVSAGIVSARGRNIESGPYDNYIQTDAAINKGNSGGPLFNMNGEVIGINTAILSPTGGSVGIGFAVPSANAKPVIEQLREFGETRRGWLGVRIQNVDDATAEALGLGTARGALIAGIDEKGPAKPAGLELGDVIVKFDGQEVKQSRDLPRIVATTPVGKTVDVVIVRKKEELTKSVTLGRLEDGEKAAAASPSGPRTGDAPAASQRALGLELSAVSEDLRRRYGIKDGQKGVVITRVDPNSSAADKRIQPGELIVEVGQEAVSSPADVAKRVETLKKEGRKSALLLVANAQGEVRFVAVTIE
ncbi:DegQ family serine endoprotease [Enterovirga rhinocerotis]|nr:DegQ family serine endoprotease [Enterovirga rhinocerotis]